MRDGRTGNNHALWPLEVEENREVERPFEIHTMVCLENTGNAVIDNQSANVECDYDVVLNEAHCDDPVMFGTNQLDLVGEIVIHGNPGVTHDA